MGIFPDIFTEMAVLLLLAAVVGALAVRLRQPLIVAFIVVGILVGPSVLGWVSANDQVDLLAKLGISLLLFLVALKLDLHIIHTMGPVALATGLARSCSPASSDTSSLWRWAWRLFPPAMWRPR